MNATELRAALDGVGAKILDEGVYWTKPVLVDGIIYCRSNEGGLVARDHRPAK